MKHISLSLAAMLPWSVLYAAEKPVTADKSNVVFILADDAGIGDFSCYGCKYGVTPRGTGAPDKLEVDPAE